MFQFLGDTISNVTSAFVTPAATNLIYMLQMVTLTGVTLYIVMTGYAIITGSVQVPFWAFMKQCLKILFITTLALSADSYTTTIFDLFKDLENSLSAAMNTAGGTPQNIYEVLDQSLNKGLDLVALCFEKAGDAGWTAIGSAFGWIIAGCTVAIGSLIVSLMGASVVLVAKFSLAIVFALGPLFIMCLLFPVTAKFFDSWLGQVLNFTLTIVIMAVIMTFAMKCYDSFIAAADFAGAQNPMYAALQIAALTGVLYHIIKQAGSIASALAGGISMHAMSLSQMASPIMSAQRGISQTVNGQSTRLDIGTGQMRTAGRLNHLARGNSMWNPRYAQKVTKDFSNEWGRFEGGKASQGK